MTAAARPVPPTPAVGDRVLVLADNLPGWEDEEGHEPYEAALVGHDPDDPGFPYRVRDDQGRERSVHAVRATGLAWAEYEIADLRYQLAHAHRLIDRLQQERNRADAEARELRALAARPDCPQSLRQEFHRISQAQLWRALSGR